MIQLIAGLGNPGQQYAKTRHNVGAWFINRLVEQENLSFTYEAKFFGEVARLNNQNQICYLLKPSTYMNESGKSVAALAQFYKIPPQSILIAHDELDFPAGTIRFKEAGGHGGHNGLRHIIQCLGSNEFCRIRIGIGHPGHKDHVLPYVLGIPSGSDRQLIEDSIERAVLELPNFISGELHKVYHHLHKQIED